MRKTVYLLLFLFSIKGFTQKNIFIGGEFTKRMVWEDSMLVFKIQIKNFSSNSIQTPDSNSIIREEKNYKEEDVRYKLKSVRMKKARLCDYFTDGPFESSFQILKPGEIKFINALLPKGCLWKNTKYKIVFFMKIKILTEDKRKANIYEIKSNKIYFEFH